MTKLEAARAIGRSTTRAPSRRWAGGCRRRCARAGCRRSRRAGSSAPRASSHSHGEGFLRFFEERCQRQGLFIFDEPESALSPSRQIEFLKLLRRMDQSGLSQVIMATHSPMLMAYPNARLLQLTKYGLDTVRVEDTEHYRLMREFWINPKAFIETVMGE
jgi:predicted ATPase